MSNYRRRKAWEAGVKAFREGKGEHTNNRQPGTIFSDDWHDGWNDEQNKQPSYKDPMDAAEIVSYMTTAEKRAVLRLSDKYQTAKEIGTTGSLLMELADFRRDVRGIWPPTQIVTYDEEYRWRGWQLTALGEQVKALLS